MTVNRTLLLAVASLLVAAACGGTGGGEGVVSLSNPAGDPQVTAPQDQAEAGSPNPEEALLAFAACMRDNGVDVEDPTLSADGGIEFQFRGAGPQDDGFDREAARSARDACAAQLDGVTLGLGRGDRTEIQDDLLAYAACMRDNGYAMNDPDFSNLGPGAAGPDGEPRFAGPFGELDPDDPVFIAAHEVCGEGLSGFGAGGPGGRGGGIGGRSNG